ncbi:MBL fold metallo-hydrolase [Natronoglycomyces albus]|uniref:MBL fold metallo-hydrolase n=1 Tax=Natronoglycomyces albus TaxID=2811108 RepID=A0A895XSY1_9ACTN|nr:MBL fold metallo-hydrolase [Natronoglycomyces albus]QSB06603.1 MBL fold metallo-hydrolase [Natronoglycomyces albus]
MNAYTGVVEPGQRADVRQLQDLTIAKFAVSAMKNNCYLLRCRKTKEQLLIDAADESDRILTEVTNPNHGGGPLKTVVTTHRHWDHVRALQTVVDATGAASMAHREDAGHIPVVTKRLDEGDIVTVGHCRLSVIHLVGHTPGSIALRYDDPAGHSHLFTGDSLFPGGLGKTTNPRDFQTLFRDVTTKLFDAADDDTWVYPGHGNDTTLGAERPQLPLWKKRGW